MSPYNANKYKLSLLKENLPEYGDQSPLQQNEYLEIAWTMCSGLVQKFSDNPLIQEAVYINPDLIYRLFTIATINYSILNHAPTKLMLLVYCIHLLDKDLIEEELRLTVTQQVNDEQVFYPGLRSMLLLIRNMFEDDNKYPRDVLPQTPYVAYTLMLLRHNDLVGRAVRNQDVYKRLEIEHLYELRCLRNDSKK